MNEKKKTLPRVFPESLRGVPGKSEEVRVEHIRSKGERKTLSRRSSVKEMDNRASHLAEINRDPVHRIWWDPDEWHEETVKYNAKVKVSLSRGVTSHISIFLQKIVYSSGPPA